MEMFSIDPDTSGISQEDALAEIKAKQIETPSELDVSEIDAEFMEQNEENTSEHLRKKYGKYGFDVESTDIGDAVIVKSIDEKGQVRKDNDGNEISLYVDLQEIFESNREESAQELQAFLKANASAEPLDTSLKTLSIVTGKRTN